MAPQNIKAAENNFWTLQNLQTTSLFVPSWKISKEMSTSEKIQKISSEFFKTLLSITVILPILGLTIDLSCKTFSLLSSKFSQKKEISLKTQSSEEAKEKTTVTEALKNNLKTSSYSLENKAQKKLPSIAKKIKNFYRNSAIFARYALIFYTSHIVIVLFEELVFSFLQHQKNNRFIN